MLAVFEQCTVGIQVPLLLFDFQLGFLDFLVAKLYLQSLELDFLGQRVILAVVRHRIQLFIVAFQTCLRLQNVTFLLGNRSLILFDILVYFLDTCVQPFQLILQVAHLERQLTPQRTLLVDSRQCCLQLEKILQLLFYW